MSDAKPAAAVSKQAALAREQRFHLLAIGRHHVRLFRSTPHSTEEVQLEGIVQNMQEFLHARQSDHLLENRMTAGPSVGSMQGVAAIAFEREIVSVIAPHRRPILFGGWINPAALMSQGSA